MDFKSISIEKKSIKYIVFVAFGIIILLISLSFLTRDKDLIGDVPTVVMSDMDFDETLDEDNTYDYETESFTETQYNETEPEPDNIITEITDVTDITTVPTEAVTTVKATSATTERPKNIEKITLNKYEVKIDIGGTDMPLVTMTPQNAVDRSEIWESSDVTIATVDGKGNIKGISAGQCTVTVKSAATPSVSAKVTVTVSEKKTTESTNPGDPPSTPTYIKGVLIANKTYALPKDYNPYNSALAPEVQTAFEIMASAAKEQGLNLVISSGFRSYDYQKQLYDSYAAKSGQAEADTYSARAGYSEHQTGLAFDLNSINSEFADTPEGIWVKDNCYKYGFIIRYPKDKQSITGYMYEPWHLRYLGTELAETVYKSGLCLEEYFNITSQYAN